jgi:hypothetical protein
MTIALLAIFAPPPGTPLLHAQQVDVIRGQVTGPEGLPIERANVTATSVSGGVNRTARTDASGRFTITFPGGEGDYFVSFTSLGYMPRRFEVKRTADQEILVADAQLQRAAALLDTVRSTASRDRVNRSDRSADISGTERGIDPGNVGARDVGDLNAMAASIPGVTALNDPNGDPAGFSVLGLSADQNATTLNGSPFGASNVPRDANVSTSLVTTPYDVSRGGFSGAQFNLRTGPGSNFIRRSTSLNVDAPQLQWTDRAARSLGQQYSNFSFGGLLSGPIQTDKSFYNLSYQLGRRASDLHSILNTDALGLRTTGISADSVSRLLGVLGGANVPFQSPSLGNSRVSQNASMFGSLDVAPPGSGTAQTFNVTGNASFNRNTPATPLTSELPSHSGDRTNWNVGVQGRHSAYLRNTILSETTIGANQSRSYGTPYLTLPNGSVLVNSEFAGGTSGVRSIGFGGNPFLGTSSVTSNADVGNQLSWFSTNNKHRLKFTTELRRESYSQDQTTNQNGSFSFNSIADLQAGRPAFYSRQLGQRVQAGSEYLLGISLGDSYKRTNDLQLQYGLRVDANRFAAEPGLNADVDRIFGTRNDRVPNDVYLSPRLGFSWTYGTAAQIAAFDGAARGPRAVVRGGIGVFQNTPNASLIGGAIDNTGLPTAVQQLTCVGAAAPIPNWQSYVDDPANVPAQCADGSMGSVFASSVPNVTLFARDFAAQRSLRSNLQWNGPVLDNRFNATVEATWSRNMNQSGAYDLNFDAGAQRFTLPYENDRPVYARPGSIVPATGAIALGDARVSPLFNRVSELRSDLVSEARQLRVGLSPIRFSSGFTWSLNYILGSTREQSRGFSSTVGNPTSVEWGRAGFDSRHQITYTLGYNFFDAVRVNWFGQFRSGTPFTPLVIGDVNGDGYNNDRAFVFDPATTGLDASLAAGMRALLDAGAPEARACLLQQKGTLAARNGCEGPWTSQATLNFSFNPLKVRLPQRANLNFQLSNPFAAADLLLHGEGRLHGWGQVAFPDNGLLYVRGFDPAAKQYRYEVNSRFGNSSPQANGFRSPVTLTAMMRIDVGPSRERQVLTQQLDRGRRTQGDKAAEALLKAQYGSGGIINPMAQILRQSDTLQLTGPQADSLATLNRWYVIRLDSIWTPVAKYLATLPREYDQGEAYGRYKEAREASVDLLIRAAPSIDGLLTPDQKRKLPAFVASYLDTRFLASIRSGTSGPGQGGFQGFGGGPVFVGGGGGGGGERVIIRTGP